MVGMNVTCKCGTDADGYLQPCTRHVSLHAELWHRERPLSERRPFQLPLRSSLVFLTALPEQSNKGPLPLLNHKEERAETFSCSELRVSPRVWKKLLPM